MEDTIPDDVKALIADARRAALASAIVYLSTVLRVHSPCNAKPQSEGDLLDALRVMVTSKTGDRDRCAWAECPWRIPPKP